MDKKIIYDLLLTHSWAHAHNKFDLACNLIG